MRIRIALGAAIAASVVLSLILLLVLGSGGTAAARGTPARTRPPARGLARVVVLGARRRPSATRRASAAPSASGPVRLVSLRWDGRVVPAPSGTAGGAFSAGRAAPGPAPSPAASSGSSASSVPAPVPAPPPPPPPPTDATSTTTPDWWCIRDHESGDNYSEDSGNGYSGAYQFAPGTWDQAVIGAGYPQYANGWAYLAPPGVQDAAALWLYGRDGWAPWSTRWVCGL